MIGPQPLCMNCVHFNFENETGNTCTAFPAGIPSRILNNQADHRREYAGDNGIRFEPIDPNREPPPPLQNR